MIHLEPGIFANAEPIKAEILDRTAPEPQKLKTSDRNAPDQDQRILKNANRTTPDQLILKISHRTGPTNISKSRTAPHRTKNIRKSRTNSDRVVRGPSGAWIPGFHMVYKLLSLIWKFQDITKIHGTIMITSSLCNRSFPLKVNHFPRYAIARGTSCKSLFLNILSQFLEIRLRNSPP